MRLFLRTGYSAMARRWRSAALFSVFVLLASPAILQEFTPRFQPSEKPGPEGIEPDNPNERAEWFYRQRAFPLKEIPVGVRERAFEQLEEIVRLRSGFVGTSGARRASAQEASVTAQPGVWTPIGPQPTDSSGSGFGNTSGRIGALAVDPRNPNVVYVGGAQGGVWKTTDGGLTWVPLTDQQPSLATGAIALAPSNPDIVYVGTGEQTFSVSSYYGAGILKSIDSGLTWQHLPGPFVGPFGSGRLSGGAFIGSLAVHPTNPDIVLAGVFQPGSSANSGILRSTDGGQTWSVRLSGAPGTEVVFASPDGQLAYAALGSPSSDPDNGVYRSTDGGQSWARISISGFPATNVGRVEIGVAPSNPNVIYASVHNAATDGLLGIFKTINACNFQGGQCQVAPNAVTWTNQNAPDHCSPQCWYDHVVRVHPTDPNVVFAGGAAQSRSVGNNFELQWVIRSLDGGSTWRGVAFAKNLNQALHVDTHAMAFSNPSSGSLKLYVGNDGGVWSTTDVTAPATQSENFGLNWTNLNATLGLTQFYPGGSFHPSTPDIGLGGTQDNSTQRYSGTATWETVTCGDGAWTAFDPTVPSTVYSNCQRIDVRRSFRNGLRGTFSFAANGINTSDRVAFIPPFIHDPNISGRLYFGTFRVWRSDNQADSWQAISPDLTGGGSGTLSAIAVAPSDSNVILTGSSTGLIFRSADGGTTWTPCTTSDLPPRFVTQVAAHPLNPTTIFATYSGFSGFVDNVGHVFRSTGCGFNWTDISGDLPNIPVNDIVIDTDADPTGNTIYIATDLGVLGTTNGGINWAPLVADPANDLPRVAVLALKLQRNSRILRAFTHGRSAWDLKLDNFTPSFNIHTLQPVTANAGSGGFVLTVRGNGFLANSRILWDTTALSTNCPSANECTATVSGAEVAQARTVQVRVEQTPGGAQSNALPFTVLTNSPPAISSISPTTAPLNGPAFTLTVNGSNFTANAVVRWNGQDRPTTFVSTTQLTAQIPSSDLMVAGPAAIRVFDPTPGAGSSAPATLLVQAAAPANDNFDSAVIVNASPFANSVATTGANAAADDPVPSCVAALPGLAESGRSRSVWYRFTAAASGTVNLNTEGSNYDTILAVFTGSPGSFSEVACNDDVDPGGIRHSQLSFSALANTAYSVMVSAFEGDGGSLVLSSSFAFAAPPFQLVPNPVRRTVTAGSSAAYTITVAPGSAGFSNAISLSCSNLPAASSCSFSPSSVTPGSNNVNVSLTISTTARTAAEAAAAASTGRWMPGAAAVWLAGFCLVSLIFLRRKPKRLAWALPVLVLLLAASLQIACGGGGGGGGGSPPPSQGTPAGTHTIVVNGTSGTAQQSVNITLQVQ